MMFSAIAKLALLVSGSVLIVAVIDYQRLLSRHANSVYLQRHLAAHVAERLIGSVPELSHGTSFLVDPIEYDLEGIVHTEISKRSAPVDETARLASTTRPPKTRVTGRVDEWLLSPLPASRVRVTFQVNVPGKQQQTKQLIVSLTDALPFQPPTGFPQGWPPFERRFHESAGTPSLSTLLLVALPCLIAAFLADCAVARDRVVMGIFLFLYVAGVAWAGWHLTRDFDGLRSLWLVILLASGWILQHGESWTRQPPTRSAAP